MQGSLAEKIGEGVFADVHGWAPGQVVNFRYPRWVVQHETQMTRAVFAAGGPAPQVIGEVTLDGRFGIVLPRFHGPTLTQATRTGGITREQAGAILATLCLAVHKTRPPKDALSLREAMDARLRFGGSVLPERITTDVLALIEHLAPDDVLCDSDLHPGNVIMTAQGPRLIDGSGNALQGVSRGNSKIHHEPLRPQIATKLLTKSASTSGSSSTTRTRTLTSHLHPWPKQRCFLEGQW
jgi:hypothetical protein